MMRRLECLALLAVVLLVPCEVYSGELVGDVSQDRTLSKAQSPYLIKSQVTVKAGVTLTVEAGVEIRIESGGLDIDGSFVVKGTGEERALLTGVASVAAVTFVDGSTGTLSQVNVSGVTLWVKGGTVSLENVTVDVGSFSVYRDGIGLLKFAFRNDASKRTGSGIIQTGGRVTVKSCRFLRVDTGISVQNGEQVELEVSESTFNPQGLALTKTERDELEGVMGRPVPAGIYLEKLTGRVSVVHSTFKNAGAALTSYGFDGELTAIGNRFETNDAGLLVNFCTTLCDGGPPIDKPTFPTLVRFERNWVLDTVNEFGSVILESVGHNSRVVGNVVYGGGGIRFLERYGEDSSRYFVLNNTIYGCRFGILASIIGSPAGTIVVQNNLVAKSKNAGIFILQGLKVEVGHNNSWGTVEVGTKGRKRDFVAGFEDSTVNQGLLAELKAANFSVDPLFMGVNPQESQTFMKLLPESPLVDRGVVDSYDGSTVDIFGTVRPSGKVWGVDGLRIDVGAVELVARPGITSVSPAKLGQGFVGEVTVKGTSLLEGGQVSLGEGISIEGIDGVDEGQLVLQVSVGPSAKVGERKLVLSGAYGSATTTLTITARPDVSQISPGSLLPGKMTELTMEGTSFASGITVTSPTDGATVDEVTRNSQTKLTLKVTTEGSLVPGETITFLLINPAGGKTSTPVTVGRNPEIESFTPSVGRLGQTTRHRIHGSGFEEGVTVAITAQGNDISITLVERKPERLVVDIQVNADAQLLDRQVTIQNPNGGRAYFQGFRLADAGFIVDRMTPIVLTPGETKTVMLSGDELVEWLQFRVVGTGVSVVGEYVSDGEWTLSFTAAQTAAVGDYDLIVTLDGKTTVQRGAVQVVRPVIDQPGGLDVENDSDVSDGKSGNEMTPDADGAISGFTRSSALCTVQSGGLHDRAENPWGLWLLVLLIGFAVRIKTERQEKTRESAQ